MKPEISISIGFPERIAISCPNCSATFDLLYVKFNMVKNYHQPQDKSTIIEGSQTYRCKECGALINRIIKAKINTEEAK